MADQREQLIEKAAKAILEVSGVTPEDDGTYWGEATWPNAVKDAEAALAVFEEANTPTDDERDSPVEGMENGFEPWVGAFDAPTEAGDEQEALIEEATWRLIEWDTDTADRGVRDEHYQDRRADVERLFPILAAGFHRTVQGEPKHTEGCIDWCNHCSVCGEGVLYGSRCPAHYLNRVQGEPSDAAVKAAAEAIMRERGESNWVEPYLPLARAALRAAAATEGGERDGNA